MRITKAKEMTERALTIGHPVLLIGSPGLGKTEMIKQVADKMEYRLEISHPVLADPTDYKGLPFFSSSSSKKTSSQPKADFIPFGFLLNLIDASEDTLVFFDDIGQASPSVQAALMQLILERSIDGKKISDKVRFVAATNRKEEKAGVSGILSPLLSRFVVFEVDVNLEDWETWACQNDMPIEVIAFIKYRPNLLFDMSAYKAMSPFPCPRQWEKVGRYMTVYGNADIFSYAAGCIGEPAATELSAFIKMFDMLSGKVEEIMANPDKVKEVEKVDETFAICSAIANMAGRENASSVIAVCEKLTECDKAEFAAMILKWAVKNSDIALSKEFKNLPNTNIGKLLIES